MDAVTSSGTAILTLPTDEQILITREFDAPKHLVYKAWTTPELVRRWWHANRGEVTVVEIDLRVGGKWRYVMVADDGFEVGFHGVYREVVADERIVTTEIEGLVIELRCKGRRTAGDVFREIGPWEGETPEELTGLLRQARAEGDSKEPPAF